MNVLEGCGAEPLFYRQNDLFISTKSYQRMIMNAIILSEFKELFEVGILAMMNKQHVGHLYVY